MFNRRLSVAELRWYVLDPIRMRKDIRQHRDDYERLARLIERVGFEDAIWDEEGFERDHGWPALYLEEYETLREGRKLSTTFRRLLSIGIL